MEDYVNQAQQVMSRIAKDGLTTSQLRLFLSAVNAAGKGEISLPGIVLAALRCH